MTSIPADQVDYLPAFLTATLPPPLVSDTVGALGHIRSLDRFTSAHRSELVDAILADLHRWEAPEEARRSAESLRTITSCAVVTGQQAGIAGGPLYTLYKAVGTIVAAQSMGEHRTDRQFVPVFWIESDDHDFDEARALGVVDRDGVYRVLRYEDGDERRPSMGDRVINPDGIARLLEDLVSALPQTEFAAEWRDLLTASYSTDGNATLADGFARFLYRLLGDTPLVVVSARNAVMKRLAVDILAAEAIDPAPTYETLVRVTDENRHLGLPTPIEPKQGCLFVTHNGERRALDVDATGYVVRGTETRYTRDEVAAIARATPHLLSPNVALRPIVQDAALPTVLYLAGPTELAYHGQLRGVYARFGLAQPSVAPRPSVLLLEPKALRAIEAGPVALHELLRRDIDIANRLIDATADAAIERERTEGVRMLVDAWNGLREIALQIDPTLEKSIGSGIASATKEMENVVRKLKGALKRREEVSIRRLESARSLILPGGIPQERALNVIGYLARYGVASIRAALEEVRPTEGVAVIHLSSAR